MLQNEIKQFRDIPNIGPAIEKSLIALGLNGPAERITAACSHCPGNRHVG